MLLTDINLALRHAQRIAKQQSPGLFLLSFHRANTGKPFKREWLDNRSPDFAKQVEALLREQDKPNVFAFYGVNSYREEGNAEKQNLAPCTMAQVDADRVSIEGDTLKPNPSIIVETSPRNHQFIYFLDRALAVDEVEAISRHLTREVRGDDNGWSANKLLRLPGTHNLKTKYKSKYPTVKVVERTMKKHSADELLSLTGRRVTAEAAADSVDVGEVKQRLRRKLSQEAQRLMDAIEPFDMPGKTRSDVVWTYGAALVNAGATRAEAFALVRDLAHWKDREKDGKAENIDRLVAKLFGDRIVLDPNDPMRSARALVEDKYMLDGARTLHHYRGDFYEWDGSRYRLADALDVTLWSFLEGAGRQGANGVEKFAPKRDNIANVREALAAVCHLSSEMEAPAWVGDASLGDIMPVRNGLLHVPSGKLHSPTPKYFNLHASGVKYDPNAPKPKGWLKFLDELWPDDDESIEALQDMFGYLLTPDTSQQKIFLLIGPKRSGKGTIGLVLSGLVGNVAGPTLAELGQPFGLAPLIGKTVAIVDDARIGASTDHAALAERLLTISGGGILHVNRKYRPVWEGRLSTRIIIMTNELPWLGDASGALASRFIVLKMTGSFFGREDLGLADRLLKELPGILNWAIEGYLELRESGQFTQPESALEAVADLETLGSPVKAFVDDKCIVGRGHCEVHALFDAWRDWCTLKGHRAGTVQKFGRDLHAVVPDLKTVRSPRPHSDTRKRAYQGITLR